MEIGWVETVRLADGGALHKASVDYGLVDEFGRKVGALMLVYQTWPDATHKGYHVRVQAARDGVAYGPQAGRLPDAFWSSPDAAKADAIVRVEQQRKRYVRKYGRR